MLYKSLLEEYKQYIKEENDNMYNHYKSTIQNTKIKQIFGNMENIKQKILKNENLDSGIKDTLTKMVNKIEQDNYSYLYLYGESEKTKQKVVILYILTTKNNISSREKQIFDVLDSVPNIQFNNVKGVTQVSLPSEGTVSIKINDEQCEISVDKIGIKYQSYRRKLKLSSITRYHYDEKTNTYIIVNSKFISHVIKCKFKNITSNSIDLEQDFQMYLYITFRNKNNKYDYSFIPNGIKIKKDSLKEFLNDIINVINKRNLSNIKMMYLKNDVNPDEIKNIIQSYYNELEYESNDEIILKYSSEKSEMILNLLVQLNTWKKIPIDESGPVYIVSENIISQIKMSKTQKMKLLKQIQGKDEKKIRNILDKIKLQNNIELKPRHKLYFSLLTMGKNQISSGDLYIILPSPDNLNNLDEYIKVLDNGTIYVNNNFDEHTLPYSFVIPISYKKLSGQRYGKFTISRDKDNSKIQKQTENITDEEIDNFVLHLFKNLSTISKKQIDSFKQYLVKVINNVSLSDIENEKTLDKKVKNLISKIKSMELSVEKNMDNILSLMFHRTLQIMDKVLDVDNIQDIDNNLEENGEDYQITLNIKLIELLLYMLIYITYQKKVITYDLEISESQLKDNQMEVLKSLKSLKNVNKSFSILEESLDEIINNKQIMSKINQIEDKLYLQLIQQLYSLIYIYVITDSQKLINLLLEIINKQLKINVSLNFEDIDIIFGNSYFITSTIDSTNYELPYLFKGGNFDIYVNKNKLEYHHDESKVESNLNVISNLYIKILVPGNKIEFIVSDDSKKKIDNLQNINERMYQLFDKIIDDEVDDTLQNELDDLLSSMMSSFTFTDVFNFKVYLPNSKKVLVFEYQYRFFGSNLTSEQVKIHIDQNIKEVEYESKNKKLF